MLKSIFKNRCCVSTLTSICIKIVVVWLIVKIDFLKISCVRFYKNQCWVSFQIKTSICFSLFSRRCSLSLLSLATLLTLTALTLSLCVVVVAVASHCCHRCPLSSPLSVIILVPLCFSQTLSSPQLSLVPPLVSGY